MSAKFIASADSALSSRWAARAGRANGFTPAVPTNLEAGRHYKPFLKTHAVGTQNYICAPARRRRVSSGCSSDRRPRCSTTTSSRTSRTTRATTRRSDAIQATWQHSRDTSAVWAKRQTARWMRLRRAGRDRVAAARGHRRPDRADRRQQVHTARSIQRVNTVGGIKPPAECTPATLNTRKLVPYEADYYFYK